MEIYWSDFWGSYENVKSQFIPYAPYKFKLVSPRNDKVVDNIFMNPDKSSVFSEGWTLVSVINNCGMVLLTLSDGRTCNKACYIAKEMGYSQIAYTLVQGEQPSQEEALIKAGFKRLKDSEFKNKRTGNVIHTWVLNLDTYKGDYNA